MRLFSLGVIHNKQFHRVFIAAFLSKSALHPVSLSFNEFYIMFTFMKPDINVARQSILENYDQIKTNIQP